MDGIRAASTSSKGSRPGLLHGLDGDGTTFCGMSLPDDPVAVFPSLVDRHPGRPAMCRCALILFVDADHPPRE